MTEVLVPLADIYGVDDDSELSWMGRGRCAEVDPELHFPAKGGSTAPAKRICRACDVRPECLEYALAHSERFGIWGGMSERERRRLSRQPVTSPPVQSQKAEAA